MMQKFERPTDNVAVSWKPQHLLPEVRKKGPSSAVYAVVSCPSRTQCINTLTDVTALDFRHYYAAGPSQMRQLCKSINGEQMINRLSSSSCRLYVICPELRSRIECFLTYSFCSSTVMFSSCCSTHDCACVTVHDPQLPQRYLGPMMTTVSRTPSRSTSCSCLQTTSLVLACSLDLLFLQTWF